MFEIKRLQATGEVLREQQKAIENFVVCDLPGFAEFAEQVPTDRRVASADRTQWWGGMTYDQSIAALRYGDQSGVAASDKLLSDMEALVPVSRSWRTMNSVIGMCPNVPQYLAGNPYNMRLKRRSTSTTAPLSIFVELVASAGIDATTCLKRGAAMLALVRMLANVRPVELWCVIAIGQRNSRSSLCVRLDTAPLDLARSAHVFTHPSVFRALGYRSLEHEFYARGWNGGWAFGDHGLHISTAAESYRRLLDAGLRCALHRAGSHERPLPLPAGTVVAHHDRRARRRSARRCLITSPRCHSEGKLHERKRHSKRAPSAACADVHLREGWQGLQPRQWRARPQEARNRTHRLDEASGRSISAAERGRTIFPGSLRRGERCDRALMKRARGREISVGVRSASGQLGVTIRNAKGENC